MAGLSYRCDVIAHATCMYCKLISTVFLMPLIITADNVIAVIDVWAKQGKTISPNEGLYVMTVTDMALDDVKSVLETNQPQYRFFIPFCVFFLQPLLLLLLFGSIKASWFRLISWCERRKVSFTVHWCFLKSSPC